MPTKSSRHPGPSRSGTSAPRYDSSSARVNRGTAPLPGDDGDAVGDRALRPVGGRVEDPQRVVVAAQAGDRGGAATVEVEGRLGAQATHQLRLLDQREAPAEVL